jgi:hypothetical protein
MAMDRLRKTYPFFLSLLVNNFSLETLKTVILNMRNSTGNHKVKIFLVGSFLIFFGPVLFGQNAPVTTLATVGNAVPGQVAVPVTAVNFTNIGAISLSMEYTYSVLHFIQGIPNPQLSTFSVGDVDLGNGKHRISMGWFGSGKTLGNGSTIITLYFTYISGSSALEWYDNGPSCEYADGNYNVLNDIPTSTYYINGFVCSGISNPGTIAGSTAVCQGQNGSGYSISPLTNVTGYVWSVPAGASIVNGTNTNAIIVDYSLTAVPGSITVNGINACGNGPQSQLSINVGVLPVANAGNDTTIPYGTSTQLHAANPGPGTFTFHWSPESLLVNPNVQSPQTVNLNTTTLFNLSVTNTLSLCDSSDEKIVNISGGPLSVNPIADPSSLCRGLSSQLYSNAGGGSGNYSYSWTCTPSGSPPWTSNQANPLVIPDSTRIYHLSVNDGFNAITGNTQVSVFQLPTATISGGDTLCGEGITTTLTINLTGVPPWNLVYTNGLTTYSVYSVSNSPYLIETSVPGTYIILSVTDVNCSGPSYGYAVVEKYPVPPTPEIFILGTDLSSSSCCGNQWYKEGAAIPGATGQIFTPLQTAHYFDIVTLEACSSDTSNDIYFVMVGMKNHSKESFSLDPNPANGFLNIKTNTLSGEALHISISTLSGTVLRSVTLIPSFPGITGRLDISELGPGMYMVTIRTSGTTEIKKLIVY